MRTSISMTDSRSFSRTERQVESYTARLRRLALRLVHGAIGPLVTVDPWRYKGLLTFAVTPKVPPHITARYGEGLPMALSLWQAAVAVGRSKPTLQRAIKNGKLSAIHNENGSYNIDESELARVYPEQWCNRYVTGTLKQGETLSNPDTLQAEIKGLRQQIALLRDERDDLRRRLDTEAEERRRLTRLLTDQRAAISIPVERSGGGLAGWWQRLWSG